MTYSDRQAATEALEEALERVDPGNSTGAARAAFRVVRRYDPDASSSADAFRHTVAQELEPWFNGAAKDVGWALADAPGGSGHSGHASPRGGGVGEEWPEPVSLGPEPPRDIDAECLPSPLREHVESVAAYSQTPTGLPLVLALASASTAVAGNVDVRVRRKWEEPVNLYVAAVLDPANRKSLVEKVMTAPLREYQREKAEEVGPKQRRALDRQEALEKRLESAKRAASKADTADEEGAALSNMEETRDRLEDLEVPTPPRLLTNDVTPEALGRLMDQQHGRASIISSEGDVLRIFAGKYSTNGDPTLDLIKKAWSGDATDVDRVGREGVHLDRPLLTVGLTLQEALLSSLGNREVLDGEGVLARFLWVSPPSLIGRRKTGGDVPPPDEDARERFEALLRRLLEAGPAEEDEDGRWTPHVLDLTDEARERLYAWEADVEGMLSEGGELDRLRAWGGKLVGTTVRVAGVLHVAERAGRGLDPFGAPVSAAAMRSAVQLARSLIPHARYVLAGEIGMDPDLELAQYVLRRIREAGGPELTVRDVWHLTRGKAAIEEVEDVREVLQRLESHHLVRVVERSTDGPGRKPSPLVRLNPHARVTNEGMTKMTRKGGQEGETPHSGNTGHVTPRGEGANEAADREEDAVAF